jgi:hypothetical protein
MVGSATGQIARARGVARPLLLRLSKGLRPAQQPGCRRFLLKLRNSSADLHTAPLPRIFDLAVPLIEGSRNRVAESNL